MLDQVRPEGGTPGMLWLASELAGAEKASHANCTVMSQTHPSGGSGLVELGNAWPSGRKARGRSSEMDVHRLCCMYLSIYCHVACR